jgi:hypothetical protein
VIALVIYFYSSGTPSDSSIATLILDKSAETTDVEAAGARVLSLLNQINSLKIDTTLFDNPTYKSLIDYSITVPEQNVGRPNPFAAFSESNFNIFSNSSSTNR